MATLGDVPAFELAGDTVDWQEVVDFLRGRDRLAPLVEEAVDHIVAVRAARELGIEATDPELQRAADAFREARELHEASRTFAWLEERGLTIDDFERMVEEDVLVEKLRDRIASERAEAFFAENRVRLDAVELSHIVVGEEGTARELGAQVTEDGADFAGLARHHSIDAETASAGGYLGVLRRRQVPAVMEAAVFGARPGDLVGPFRTPEGFHLVRVHAVKTAALDAETRATIREVLFREWLQAERKRAGVRLL
jgi:putative peptide maturation system protein